MGCPQTRTTSSTSRCPRPMTGNATSRPTAAAWRVRWSTIDGPAVRALFLHGGLTAPRATVSSTSTAPWATTTASGRSSAPTASARSRRKARRAGGRRVRAPHDDRTPVRPLRGQRRLARHPPAHDAVGPCRPRARRHTERVPPAARRRHLRHGAAPRWRWPRCPRSRSTGAGASRSASRNGAPTWPKSPGRRRASSRRSTPSTVCRSTPPACTRWRAARRCPARGHATDGQGTPSRPRRVSVRFRAADPEERAAAELLAEMRAELTDVYETFTRLDNPPLAPAELRAPGGVYLVGYDGNDAVAGEACDGSTTAWRRSSACTCGRRPGRAGWPGRCWRRSKTRRPRSGTAPRWSTRAPSRSTWAASYRSAGYVEVPPYNENPFARFGARSDSDDRPLPSGTTTPGCAEPGRYCGGVSTQVTIVGGGSYQWGPELMATSSTRRRWPACISCSRTSTPPHCRRWRRWPARPNERMGAKATVATTTDQRRPSTAPTSSIVDHLDRGLRSMAVDLDVPADTGSTSRSATRVGPGGINRALRNIPVLVGIGQDMEELCPDAWLLNITNPMTCLTRSVCRETLDQDRRSVPRGGQLLHGPGHRPGQAPRGGADRWSGVNHFPVVTALEVDGADGFDDAARRGRRGRAASEPRWPPPGSPRGRDVLRARLRPASRAQAHPARPLGRLPGRR